MTNVSPVSLLIWADTPVGVGVGLESKLSLDDSSQPANISANASAGIAFQKKLTATAFSLIIKLTHVRALFYHEPPIRTLGRTWKAAASPPTFKGNARDKSVKNPTRLPPSLTPKLGTIMKLIELT